MLKAKHCNKRLKGYCYYTLAVSFDKEIEQLVKTVYHMTEDTVFRGIEGVQDVAWVYPILADKWGVFLKLTEKTNLDTLLTLIKGNSALFFVIKIENYKVFKKFKQLCENLNVKDIITDYLRVLNREDYDLLYYQYVSKSNRVAKRLSDTVFYEYRGLPDKVMLFFQLLEDGETFNTFSDVVRGLGGLGRSGVNVLLKKVITTGAKTEQGYKRLMKELAERLDASLTDYGQEALKRLAIYTLRGYIDIKLLDQQGYTQCGKLAIDKLDEVGYVKKKGNGVKDLGGGGKLDIVSLKRFEKELDWLDEVPISKLLDLVILFDTLPNPYTGWNLVMSLVKLVQKWVIGAKESGGL